MTSSRVRSKSLEIIQSSNRPLSVHEIEIYLRMHDPILWNEVSSKCSNYLRIILSTTKRDIITKYKSKIPLYGIDKRALFFGKTGVKYNQADWISVDDSIDKSDGIDDIKGDNSTEMEKIKCLVHDHFCRIYNKSKQNQEIFEEILEKIEIPEEEKKRNDISETIRKMIDIEIESYNNNSVIWPHEEDSC